MERDAQMARDLAAAMESSDDSDYSDSYDSEDDQPVPGLI